MRYKYNSNKFVKNLIINIPIESIILESHCDYSNNIYISWLEPTDDLDE